MFSKKGDLELRYVILFILAVIVLLAIVFMFREQVSKFMSIVFSVTDDINKTRPPIKDILGT